MTEEQAEGRYRLRNRWLAAFAVASCYGLSAFFVTGDSVKGAGFFLLVMAIYAALLLLAPRRWVVEKPLRAYLVAGLGVLLGPFLVLAVGQRRTPWNDLEARYATVRPAPAGFDSGDRVVLLQPVDEVLVHPYPFRGATTAVADGGVYLALSWPLSMVYDPLWLPVATISHCRPSGIDPMYASLAVDGVAARVELLDPGEDVLRWCRERGIPGQERPGPLR